MSSTPSERDAETGLDYFEARYYGVGAGLRQILLTEREVIVAAEHSTGAGMKVATTSRATSAVTVQAAVPLHAPPQPANTVF